MAITVHKAPQRQPSFGERFARSVGPALEAGLGKYEQLQKEAEAKQLMQQENQQFKEMTGHDISGIQDPKIRQEAFKQAFKTKQTNDLLQSLGFGNEGSRQPGRQESQQQMQDQINPETGEISVGIESLIPDAEIQRMAVVNRDVANQMREQNKRIISEQQHGETLRQKELEAGEKLDYQSFKDNEKYVEKVLGGYEGYKREKAVLDQMEKIGNKGNLPTPLLVQALSKVGLPLGLLENPDAEQFEKLSQELMKGIQGTYGSRILQSEVQNFMKSIPTLLNSPEGQKRLIQQWKILNEGKKIYYDAYKDVRKQYPKRLPADLHEKVLEQADEKLDKLANKFGYLADIPSDYVKTPGKFLVMSPDGQMGEIGASEIEDALKAGYEYLE